MSEAAPLSPCIALCVLDPASGYCRGCFRTIDEIAGWMALTPEEKGRVLAQLALRRAEKVRGAPGIPNQPPPLAEGG